MPCIEKALLIYINYYSYQGQNRWFTHTFSCHIYQIRGSECPDLMIKTQQILHINNDDKILTKIESDGMKNGPSNIKW